MNVEFDGRPLIAGEMVGLRSFKVDKLGRLTGASYEVAWRPGENVAECAKQEKVSTALDKARKQLERQQTLYSSYAAIFSSVTTTRVTVSPSKVSPMPEHHVGELHCGCGFWAYFDTEANPYHGDGQVRGIIEGYGTVTAGSRGFRASKARLVALIDDRHRLNWWQRLTFWARFDFAAIVADLVMVALYIAGVAVGSKWAVLADGIAAAALAAIVYATRSKLFRPAYVGVGVPDAVRRNYADVPVYPSMAAALADHPLTPPPPLTPDTDPDFWTRTAS